MVENAKRLLLGHPTCKNYYQDVLDWFKCSGGVFASCNRQENYLEAFSRLKNVEGQMRGLLVEPLLGPLSIKPTCGVIDWVVVGGTRPMGGITTKTYWVLAGHVEGSYEDL